MCEQVNVVHYLQAVAIRRIQKHPVRLRFEDGVTELKARDLTIYTFVSKLRTIHIKDMHTQYKFITAHTLSPSIPLPPLLPTSFFSRRLCMTPSRDDAYKTQRFVAFSESGDDAATDTSAEES